jgi:hypothetical protein
VQGKQKMVLWFAHIELDAIDLPANQYDFKIGLTFGKLVTIALSM